MKVEQNVISEGNLSIAWAKAMLPLILEPGVDEVSPLMVKVSQPEGLTEVPEIRALLDETLEAYGNHSCDTVANTIFPRSLWVPSLGRQRLYDQYLKLLPRLKKFRVNKHCPNQHGLYFERLIAYGPNQVNQLEHIISTWKKGNHRRSELQATILDPTKDHSDARTKGFPCLQQVTLSHDKDGLTVIGYYGVQYIFERAYGNYLGLYRLGQFMAHEMDLPFSGLVCLAGVAHRGNPGKTALKAMGNTLQQFVKEYES